MSFLPHNSVDLIFADPPFEVLLCILMQRQTKRDADYANCVIALRAMLTDTKGRLPSHRKRHRVLGRSAPESEACHRGGGNVAQVAFDLTFL